MRNKLLSSGLPILFLAMLGRAQTQVCPDEHVAEQQAIAFLKASKYDSHVPDHCVVSAIRSLEYSHSRESIAVLVNYLDWARSEEVSEEVVTGANMFHPAVSALFAIGKPALPALARVLLRTDVSKVARENAVETIMSIHRDNPEAGIHFLLSRAAESKDGGEASMLRQAASEAVRWCGDERHRAACEAMLNSE